MSFINVGTDGAPNHTLEVEGDVFVSNVENGTIIPVVIQGNTRFRNKPPGAGVDDYRVTDMNLESQNLFGITGPSSEATRSTTDFCIDSTGNVGIGVVPTEKLDVAGSMYATGSLTNESNIITGTLTSTAGTLTCNAIAHGEYSNIYGLLPSNVILMTTLTSTPNGWTDITSQFTNKNVLLAGNQATLTASGNDNFSLPSNYTHNHNWVTTHNVNHNHNVAKGNMSNAGNHAHTRPNTNLNTGAMENHNHNFGDRSVAGDRGEANLLDGWIYRTKINWGISPNYLSYRSVNTQNTLHSHGGGNYGFNSSNMAHGHSVPNLNTNNDSGGTHIHNFGNSGSNNTSSGTSFSIVPPYYTLRFIKKN